MQRTFSSSDLLFYLPKPVQDILIFLFILLDGPVHGETVTVCTVFMTTEPIGPPMSPRDSMRPVFNFQSNLMADSMGLMSSQKVPLGPPKTSR